VGPNKIRAERSEQEPDRAIEQEIVIVVLPIREKSSCSITIERIPDSFLLFTNNPEFHSGPPEAAMLDCTQHASSCLSW